MHTYEITYIIDEDYNRIGKTVLQAKDAQLACLMFQRSHPKSHWITEVNRIDS